MSKIGGYQIIDFGGVDLDDITTQTEVSIKTSTKGLLSGKRVVFSGLTKSGVQLNDFGVTVVDENKVYVLGYVFTINKNNNICSVVKDEDGDDVEPSLIVFRGTMFDSLGSSDLTVVLEQRVSETFPKILDAVNAGKDVVIIAKQSSESWTAYFRLCNIYSDSTAQFMSEISTGSTTPKYKYAIAMVNTGTSNAVTAKLIETISQGG